MQIPASCPCQCGMPFPEDPRGSFMAPLPEGVRCLVCDDALCEWPVSRIIFASYAQIHESVAFGSGTGTGTAFGSGSGSAFGSGSGSVIIRHGASASVTVLSADQSAKCNDAPMSAESKSNSNSMIESEPNSCLTCGKCCNNPVVRFVADQKPEEVKIDLMRIAAKLKK
jgi:hypothetical protein